MDEIKNLYANPNGIFVGANRRQRGGGFFGRIARFALPILKKIGGILGNEALNFAGNTINDLQQGHDLKSTLRKRGVESLSNATNTIIKKRNLIN